MVAVIAWVVVLMTETVSGPLRVTYKRVPSALTAAALAPHPTSMVPVTVLVAVLITDTVPALVFTTYAREPSELKTTAPGAAPTGIVPNTAGDGITDTVTGTLT